MTSTLMLPTRAGQLQPYTLHGAPLPRPRPPHRFDRVAFAAAHVVADACSDRQPGEAAALDWAATLGVRRHLLDLGLGVAEAMDTAQRGMGLDWPAALELIRQSLAAAAPAESDRIVAGIGTDHLAPTAAHDLDAVMGAYLDQLEAVQRLGGRVVVMASRALARRARGAEDYVRVYDRVLAACDRPVILHWLGEAFDPELRGYWDPTSIDAAMETVLAIIHAHAARIDGIKLSLLDAEREVAMRRRLPAGVRMYTGDDFAYPALIAGDDAGHSDALLGIFGPIAPAASIALAALAHGDRATFDRVLAPTVPLARKVFAAPTRHYKTGVVFLAWLDGLQDHFVMVGGAQSMRSLPHFAELFRLADAAGLLREPDLAAARMRRLLALYGIDG